jgi:ketosteroid isomerase-like protein
MSEENVEIVRKALDAFNAFSRGEMSSETLAELLDPQLEWHWRDERTIPDVPQHLRSAAELIESLERFRGAWIDLAVEPLEFIEAPGDRVVTLIRQSGRGQGSGVSIVFHYFFVCTIREGKVRTWISSAIVPRPSKPPGCGSRRPLLWTKSATARGGQWDSGSGTRRKFDEFGRLSRSQCVRSEER